MPVRRVLATGGVLILIVAVLKTWAGAERTTSPNIELLWSTAPGALGKAAEDQPSLAIYLPPRARAVGTAIVVFPGGGYQFLSLDREGDDVARWLNSLGLAVFVVSYRLGPKYSHPVMLRDAQRAIRTVRARAKEWAIDPSRVGALGFSAGGHLASTVATHFTDATGDSADPIDSASSRPDFLILVYPVITMRKRYTHLGSRENLIGPAPDTQLVNLLSNENHVTTETPPTFLVHATDDDVVPVENSLMFYEALHAARVPAEMHIYADGRHGFGLAQDDPVLSSWVDRCEAWMASRKLLERAEAVLR
jgi:acetyl esterase/lipase